MKRGAQREEQGVVPELPAGSQCPELAQHVDTEPVPDLKPPFSARGKEVKGFKDKSDQYELKL